MALSKALPSTSKRSQGFYGDEKGNWNAQGQTYQRLSTPTSGSTVATLGEPLPAGACIKRILYRNHTALTLVTAGTVTGTPNAVAVYLSTSSSLATNFISTATATASSNWIQSNGMIGLIQSTASNASVPSTTGRQVDNWGTLSAVTDGKSATAFSLFTNCFSTATSPRYMHFIPADNSTNTANQRFMMGTTDSYLFSTSTTSAIDVVVVWEYSDEIQIS